MSYTKICCHNFWTTNSKN